MSPYPNNDIERIKDTLIVIDGRLDSIDSTLARQSVDLAHHIDRTDKLEALVTPIRNSHQQILGIFKFMGFVGLLISIAEGLGRLSAFLHH